MSTTVSNPYSFNITSNKSFTSPSIAANLPTKETPLTWYDYTDDYDSCYTIIPLGVNIIKGYKHKGPIYIGVTPGKKYICSCIETNTFDYNGREDYGQHIYNMNSNVTWYKTDAANYGDSNDYWFLPTNQITYSASINNQTPNITDY